MLSMSSIVLMGDILGLNLSQRVGVEGQPCFDALQPITGQHSARAVPQPLLSGVDCEFCFHMFYLL